MAKRDYSLTGKERKQKKRAGEEKKKQKEEKKGVNLTPKKKKIIVITAMCMAVVMLATAILIPFLPPSFPGIDNPVARIQLVVNGRRHNLDIELFADESPIAVKNFMFLARQGFFDNTIVSDVGGNAADRHGFVRFGGFERPDASRTVRATNPRFYDRFPLLQEGREHQKIGYRLREAAMPNTRSHLTQYNVSLITGAAWGSSTIMQIAALTDAHDTVTRNTTGTPSTQTASGRVFGRVIGGHQLIQDIARMEPNRGENGVFVPGMHTWFNEPVQEVRIRQISFYQNWNWRITSSRFRDEVINAGEPNNVAAWH